MSEQNKPFVVTDRRKFTLDGEVRPDAAVSEERKSEDRKEEKPAEAAAPAEEARIEAPAVEESAAEAELPEDAEMVPGPTTEQAERARAAYEATADRLDTAIRAANPGAEHPPAVSFDSLVQSIYMSALMQLGGGTPEGQAPQVDIIGARQSIDMLSVLAEKSKGNLSAHEQQLLDSALFELHMAFLEITQAIARQAAAKMPNTPGVPGKPSIVR